MSGVTCPNCEMVLTQAGGICPHCAELVGAAPAQSRPGDARGGITVVPLLKANAVQPKPKELEIERGSPKSEHGSFFELPEEALQLARPPPVRSVLAEQAPPSPPSPSAPAATGKASGARARSTSPLVWVGVVVVVLGLAGLASLLLR